jgi:hypothetical protein
LVSIDPAARIVAEVRMRRLCLLFAASLAASLVFTAPVYGQAAAEAGLGAAASSLGTAGAGGIGKSTAGILNSLNKTLNPNGATTSSPTTTRTTTRTRAARKSAAAPAPAAPPPVYEDALQIDKDMEYADLLRRFGPPAMQISNGSEGRTLTYVSAGGTVQVEVQGGRVMSVVKPKSGA